jgi:hypothetical protein
MADQRTNGGRTETTRYLPPPIPPIELSGYVVLTASPGKTSPIRGEVGRLLVAAVAEQNRALAERFAEAVRERVLGVWLSRLAPSLLVSVVTREPNLDEDLQLRAIFLELAEALTSDAHAEVEIFAESRGVPDRLSEAERLT